MQVDEFNRLDARAATSLLQTCLAVPRWVDEVARGRPYPAEADLLAHARSAAATLTPAEVDEALSRHPRIGEPAGAGHDAEFSAREQSGVTLDAAEDLRRGNAEYERQFGRVFLIRAAGRCAEEILAELRRRIVNTPQAELTEVARELGEIALLRLEQIVDDTAVRTGRNS